MTTYFISDTAIYCCVFSYHMGQLPIMGISCIEICSSMLSLMVILVRQYHIHHATRIFITWSWVWWLIMNSWASEIPVYMQSKGLRIYIMNPCTSGSQDRDTTCSVNTEHGLAICSINFVDLKLCITYSSWHKPTWLFTYRSSYS